MLGNGVCHPLPSPPIGRSQSRGQAPHQGVWNYSAQNEAMARVWAQGEVKNGGQSFDLSHVVSVQYILFIPSQLVYSLGLKCVPGAFKTTVWEDFNLISSRDCFWLQKAKGQAAWGA